MNLGERDAKVRVSLRRAPGAETPPPTLGEKNPVLFQVPRTEMSNPECKSCKTCNSRTFSPELGSASQRRGHA